MIEWHEGMNRHTAQINFADIHVMLYVEQQDDFEFHAIVTYAPRGIVWSSDKLVDLDVAKRNAEVVAGGFVLSRHYELTAQLNAIKDYMERRKTY